MLNIPQGLMLVPRLTKGIKEMLFLLSRHCASVAKVGEGGIVFAVVLLVGTPNHNGEESFHRLGVLRRVLGTVATTTSYVVLHHVCW